MNTTSANEGLYIHPDLEGDNQQVDTSRFCIPIYIAGGFGISLEKEADFFPAESDQPKIRSGTLTFIKRDGQVYGITCRHVVEALERRGCCARGFR